MADNRVPAQVCRWFGGKKAALSLRFDDSHPTHIQVALPLLNEFGLTGTFLVNPGNPSYQQCQAVWENDVLSRGHELANHTLNHCGARTDKEADHQIGAPATLLRRLQPGHAQIMFEPGGATCWFQRKPFAFFEAKYHLYDVSDQAGRGRNVMSCSEVYPSFSIETFRRRLEQILADGDWFQPHFHQIDETGHLRITPSVFRQVLEVAREHAPDLWQTGMTAIHQYEEERDRAAVWVQGDGDDVLLLDLTCATEPRLFTQPLTLEVELPSETAATVTDAAGKAIPSRVESAGGGAVLRFDAPPVDARYTVRALGIGAAARAPEFRAPGPHPYLLFSADEVPGLLARNSDPLAEQLYKRIIERADSLQSEPLPEFSGTGRLAAWSRMGRELWPIDLLGLAYALTGNRAYAEAAAPRLERVAAAEWWYEQNSEMLITAETIRTLGTAYDWMFDALTEGQRAALRAAMVEYGIRPILAATENGDWWTAWYQCNWGLQIYSEFGIAALALLADEPEAADWVRLSQRKSWHYLQSLNEDGSWGESATYAAAWSCALMFMHALRRVTGADLFDSDRLRKLPRWFVTLLEPGCDNFVPFSDCQRGASSALPVLLRLAHEYGDGQAQLIARQMLDRRGRPDIFAYLWYDPAVVSHPRSPEPLDTLFRDLGWAFLRSSWDDPAATLFALKGGHKEWDHNHHDTNSFVLYAHGRSLLIDLFYPHDIWGCRTQAHNTVMVNGEEQAGPMKVTGIRGDPDHRGIIGGFVTRPWYARMVGDASMAYEPDTLTSFVREVIYLRQTGAGTPPDYFLLFDDIGTPAPSRIDWLLHTYGDVQRAPNGFTITQDNAAVQVTLVSPEHFTSEIKETKLADIQTPEPFDGAPVVRTIAVQPTEQASRTFFLSVLAPRAACAPAPLTIAPVREINTLGADIAAGAIRDRALFALDAPEMNGAEVEAVGRSALIRQSGGRLASAAIHNGQRLAADGSLLFETDSAGHAVLTVGDGGVEATLDLYNATWVRLRSDVRPAKVMVDGRECPFEYDDAARIVRLKHWNPRTVQVLYR